MISANLKMKKKFQEPDVKVENRVATLDEAGKKDLKRKMKSSET